MSTPVRLMVCVALLLVTLGDAAAQRRTRLEPRYGASGLMHAWDGVRLTFAATLRASLGGLNKCDDVCMDGLIVT